jgi:predicted CXXCH cytochrome family protein
MAGPQRYTTKVRAKRIALQYWAQAHPFRRWKTILSIAAPLLGALWLLVSAARDDQRIYNGGPVSTAHAMFETECRLCHGPGSSPMPGAPVTQASLVTAANAAPAGFFLPVTDAACKTCHAGPDHNARSDTPACGSCHVEHVGKAVLVQIADRHCVQCHGDLRTKDGKPSEFHAKVPDLGGHPQFAVSVPDERKKLLRVRLDAKPGPVDPTQIKLNHAKHLKVNLKGIEELQKKPGVAGLTKVKDGVQLGCVFCHTPDERGQYMQELAYEKHCAACHPLDFDGRFPDSVVPHTKPAIVRAFLRGTLAEAFEQCQAIPAGEAGKPVRDRCVELELAKAPPAPAGDSDQPRGMRRRGGGAEVETPAAPPADEPRGGRRRSSTADPEPSAAPEPSAVPDTPRGARLRAQAGAEEAPSADAPRGRRGRAAAEEAPAARPGSWAATQFGTIEPGLFKQRCEYCHTVTRDGESADIVPPSIPARWLPHSRFDHGAHRPVACTECHAAGTSTETKDLLMPKIETCRDCHQPKVGARSGCVECHRYHDKAQERDPNGPFKVQQLRTSVGGSGHDRIR